MTKKFVCVAIPLILDSRFSTVLSHDKISLEFPEICKIFWFALTLEPSILNDLVCILFNLKISLANLIPAIIPSSLEII